MLVRNRGAEAFERQFDQDGLLTDEVVIGSIRMADAMFWPAMLFMAPGVFFLDYVALWGAATIGRLGAFSVAIVAWSLALVLRPIIPWSRRSWFGLQTGIDTTGMRESRLQSRIRVILSARSTMNRSGLITLCGLVVAPIIAAMSAISGGTADRMLEERYAGIVFSFVAGMGTGAVFGAAALRYLMRIVRSELQRESLGSNASVASGMSSSLDGAPEFGSIRYALRVRGIPMWKAVGVALLIFVVGLGFRVCAAMGGRGAREMQTGGAGRL
jgi:hypothetical protein